MRLCLLSITFLILTFSCNNVKIKKVIVDDVIAESEISNDTIYNGIIKFYDTATKKLVQTANYKAGVLDGNRIDYYSNGKIKVQLHYNDGKINGEVKEFDTTGNLKQTQNLYFDLRAGSTIEYKNKQVSQYYFYSLENKELLHIDYDSIQGKKIEQLNNTNFFFYHFDRYSISDSESSNKDLFLYIPNPPKLNFNYSVCIIDDKYQIKQTIKECIPHESWEKINLDYSILKTNESFAIRLTIDNEFDNNDDTRIAYMFKKL